MACAVALMTLATACGGNKTTAADSDSMVGMDSTEIVDSVDSIAEDTAVAEPVEEVAEAAATVKQEAKKGANTVKNTVKEGADKAAGAAQEAVETTKSTAAALAGEAKKVAQDGMDAAQAKKDAWANKRKTIDSTESN